MATANETITISPPKFRVATFSVRGTAPYVQNKFGPKARGKMLDDQTKGSAAKSKKKKEPRDIESDFNEASRKSEDGTYGIPAVAFRNAMIDACRAAGYVMTRAQQALFIEPDGFDPDDMMPLVNLDGEPEVKIDHGTLQGRTSTILIRPAFRKWGAKVRVKFDADMLALEDVYNLLMRAGAQVGVGAGRPGSKSSRGMGWGTFEIINSEVTERAA